MRSSGGSSGGAGGLGRRGALQRLVGQRMRRVVAVNGQELLGGVGRVFRCRQLGQAKARDRLVLEGRGAALDQLRVSDAGPRAVADHPLAVGDPPGSDVVRPPGGLSRRQAIEVLARRRVVTVVELALREQVQRPVVIAQAAASDQRRQRLDRGVILAGAIGAEAAAELGDRRAGCRRRCGRRVLRAVGARGGQRGRHRCDDQRRERASKPETHRGARDHRQNPNIRAPPRN